MAESEPRQTQPRLFWKHDIIMGVIHAGIDVDWFMERFEARLTGWYNAGESVQGALDMILFTWKQEPIELRKDGSDRQILRVLRRVSEDPSLLFPNEDHER